MKKCELLAPVGTIEGFNVAIANNADAIYLGLDKFQARAKMQEFNEDNIEYYVNTAHLFGVKVYLTINTLIKESEICDFISMMKKIMNFNIDAFIIQDLGVAQILRKHFPGIVMHASTQMGINNLYSALIAKNIGFSRIVLARETTLEDIKKIKQVTGLELEYFIQGALCVCYSGNCYLSSQLFKLSGNRGACTQPCRLKYELFENKKFITKGYLLSTRDLCLASRIDELINAGIDSFKIEGRYRRPAYMGGALKIYSSILNGKTFNENDNYELKKLFARGDYNTGTYLSRPLSTNIINKEFSNHRGVFVGKVVKVEQFKTIYKIVLNINHNLITGDGLKFINNNNEISLGVGNVNKLLNGMQEIFSINKPIENSDVYLTLDALNEKNILSTKRKLPISATLRVNGSSLILSLKHNSTEICVSTTEYSTAIKSPTSKENIISALSRTKETNFEITKIDVNELNIIIKSSTLNKLRTNGLKLLEEKLIESYPHISVTYKEYNKTSFVNHEFKGMIINEKTIQNSSRTKILAPHVYSENIIKTFINKEKNCGILIPTIITTRELETILNAISSYNHSDIIIYANNLSALYFAQQGFKVITGTMMNIINSYALDLLREYNIFAYVSSTETYLNELNGLSFSGNKELMTITFCPIKEFIGTNCNNCKYSNNYKFVMENNTELKLRRYKIDNCYFTLNYASKTEDTDIIDIRD
ncbi:MAG: U32 family peptidase [Clostridia bacterium]